MAFLQRLVETGLVADLILCLLVAEAVGLLAYWRLARRGVPPMDVLIYFASGASLLMALRVALTDGHWTWIALALSASFIAHLIDLARRWRI